VDTPSAPPFPKHPKFWTGGIHIIESLKPGEIRTGESLHGVVEPICSAAHPPIRAFYHKVATRGEFIGRLERIAEWILAEHRAPIIHIECHGCGDGLSFASDEFITWSDLQPLLTKINVLCNLNLLVTLGACHGMWLVHVIQPAQRAAVWGLVGSSRAVKAREIEPAFSAFFWMLFARRDGALAVEAMNDAVADGDRPFHFFGAEQMFGEAFRQYLKVECSDARLDERVRAVIDREEPAGLPVAERRRRHALLRKFISDHRRMFESMKEDFFFLRRNPENQVRFPISYENVAS